MQGLLPEVREVYVILQQPENLESAENFAKLKESVFVGSGKRTDFNPKEVSAQILEELTKAINPKDKSISAVSQDPYVSKSELKQITRDELRELMGSASSRPSGYNQRSNQSFQSRGFRSSFEDAVCYNCGQKGILIIFAALNLILEILVVEAVDKFFARIEVKMLLIGNLSSSLQNEPVMGASKSKFIARIVRR